MQMVGQMDIDVKMTCGCCFILKRSSEIFVLNFLFFFYFESLILYSLAAIVKKNIFL